MICEAGTLSKTETDVSLAHPWRGEVVNLEVLTMDILPRQGSKNKTASSLDGGSLASSHAPGVIPTVFENLAHGEKYTRDFLKHCCLVQEANRATKLS